MNLLTPTRSKTVSRLAMVMFAVLLVGLATDAVAGGTGAPRTLVTYEAPPREESSSQTMPSASGLAALEALQNQFRVVSEMVLPVVVEINVVDLVNRQMPRFSSPFNFRFGPQGDDESSSERQFRQQGLGSGVIIGRSDETVYVLTNDHVVSSADEIGLTLYDGRTFEATIVGTDSGKDLALVTFDTAEDVPIAVLGDSDSLHVGDWVFAIGNPLGFESTVTQGIVSALGRRPDNATVYTDYIQTDAAVNQGNSGGALVNLYGEVIGINSWIASNSGGSIGLSFAIPINTAKRAIKDFIETGSVAYGWLGITVGTLDGETKGELGYDGLEGGFVHNVVLDSPADTSGLLAGDLITRIGDVDISGHEQLTGVVGSIAPGETTTFTVRRFGETLTIDVTIGRRDEAKIDSSPLWPGISLAVINDSARTRFGIPDDAGNLVVGEIDPDSPAYAAGLRANDIIKTLDGRTLEGLRDFFVALSSGANDTVEFQIYRLDTNRRGAGSEKTIRVLRD